jgi:signal transduction histidine kinase
MLPVLVFPILVASLSLGAETGGVISLLIAVAYAAALIVNSELRNAEHLYAIIMNVLLFLIVTLVGGVLRPASGPKVVRGKPGVRSEVDRANRRTQIVQAMAATLSSTLDYDRVLRSMLDLSLAALNEDRRAEGPLIGLVMLFTEERNFDRLRVFAGRNIPRTDEKRVISVQSGIVAQAVRSAEPVISNEVSDDPALAGLIGMQNAKSALCVPLRAGLDMFGVVVFASTDAQFFSATHAELLNTFSHQAVIALKNARLYQDLLDEQRKILEKEAEARHKLARELHDGATQTIAAMAMRLNFTRLMVEKKQPAEKVIEELSEIESLARKTTQEVRMMLFTLRPVVLESQGLVAALEQYADRLYQTDKLRVVVDDGGYSGQLDREAESVVFAVVEEAVGNTKKHAKANTVHINLRSSKDLFVITIQDNGRGFDVQSAQTRREAGHMGLMNMEERAEYLGGRCVLLSQPGEGTTVRLEIPLSGKRESID